MVVDADEGRQASPRAALSGVSGHGAIGDFARRDAASLPDPKDRNRAACLEPEVKVGGRSSRVRLRRADGGSGPVPCRGTTSFAPVAAAHHI